MPREAELADGTILEFPDETTDDVMQTAVKKYLVRQAVEGGVEKARAGAEARAASPSSAPPEQLSPTQEFARARMAQTPNVPGAAVPAALGLLTAPGTIASLIASPAAFARAALISGAGAWGGAKAGGEVGGWFGHPEAGRVVGGIAGSVLAPMAGASRLAQFVPGQPGAWLRSALGTEAAEAGGAAAAQRAAAAEQKATQAAADAAAKAEERAASLAVKREQAQRIAEMRAQAAERHAAQMEAAKLRAENLRRRLEGKPPLAAPKAATAPAEAPAAAPAPEAPPAAAPASAPASSAPAPAPSSAPAPVAQPAATDAVDLAPFDYRALKGDVPTIVQQLQQRMSLKGGEQQVKDLLAEIEADEPALAEQVRELLARGQAHPPTIYTRPAGTPARLPVPNRTAPPNPEASRQFKTLRGFVLRTKPDAKFGEKVWVELDEAGEPVRVMTPGQAARVPEERKTWVSALWGRGQATADQAESVAR